MSKRDGNGTMQSDHPSLSPNAMYRLTTHCSLGLDCHRVGVVFMNTCSLLLCFHPKLSFVMHDVYVTKP